MSEEEPFPLLQVGDVVRDKRGRNWLVTDIDKESGDYVLRNVSSVKLGMFEADIESMDRWIVRGVWRRLGRVIE